MREGAPHPAGLIAPAAIYVAVIWLGPLLYTAGLSLTDAPTHGRGAAWVGAANYAALLADPGFWNATKATVLFTLGSIVLHLLLGFLVAHLIHAAGRLRGAVQALVLIPWVTAEIAVAITWRWVFHEESGLANLLLHAVGAGSAPWRSTGGWAMAALLIAHLWRGLALSAALQLAGIEAIPRRLIDAARLDGAGSMAIALRVRLPLLSRVLAANAALVCIGALSVFALPHALTGGGPLRKTEVLSLFVVRTAFDEGRLGYAAAAGLLMAFAFGAAAALLIGMRRRHHAA